MSRKRSKNEIFTPSWVTKRMIKQDSNFLFDTFLEPTAGNGNFLVNILALKLDALKQKKMVNTLNIFKVLSSIYGIEIFTDNVRVARQRMINVLVNAVKLNATQIKKAKQIMKINVVQGNLLTMKNKQGKSVKLYKWNTRNNQVIKSNIVMKLN